MQPPPTLHTPLNKPNNNYNNHHHRESSTSQAAKVKKKKTLCWTNTPPYGIEGIEMADELDKIGQVQIPASDNRVGREAVTVVDIKPRPFAQRSLVSLRCHGFPPSHFDSLSLSRTEGRDTYCNTDPSEADITGPSFFSSTIPTDDKQPPVLLLERCRDRRAGDKRRLLIRISPDESCVYRKDLLTPHWEPIATCSASERTRVRRWFASDPGGPGSSPALFGQAGCDPPSVPGPVAV
ncbi:hypothetical protein EGW08_022855 [Elysia chlorotica]|uniref:Uncharacterized protein n=1 Tax=Elysia chlorotica TaxID=188477 RepID=A0A3S1BKM2_ELYCH|nr:hypothetical protein EGW08_022855 [Elysia chlorotica]